jgi:hypothetical protein
MLPTSTIRIKLRPREIQFGQNLATSEWINIENSISRACLPLLQCSTASGFQMSWSESLVDYSTPWLPGEDRCGDSIRSRDFLVELAVGSDGFLALEIQALPASAATLNSKPALKGYVHISVNIF